MRGIVTRRTDLGVASSPSRPLTPRFCLLLPPTSPPSVLVPPPNPPRPFSFRRVVTIPLARLSLSLSPRRSSPPLPSPTSPPPTPPPAFQARRRLTRHDDRLIHPLLSPFFFFLPPFLSPRWIERRSGGEVPAAHPCTGGSAEGGYGVVSLPFVLHLFRVSVRLFTWMNRSSQPFKVQACSNLPHPPPPPPPKKWSRGSLARPR